MRFADRVVVLTGGARGIGEATARRFAAEGADLLLVDIDAEGAERVAREARAAGGRVEVCIADVGGEPGWSAIAKAAGRRGRVDVVVNNATGPEVGPILQISEAGWQRTFDTNVGAVWRSARALVPLMKASRAGVFVNISSNAALNAVPGLSAYGAAKAAILSLTRSLALELAPLGIRACSITPGVILSPMIAGQVEAFGRERFERGLGTRCGTPDELARVVLFLASEDAAYVNGENVQVDGGWFASRSTGDGLRFE